MSDLTGTEVGFGTYSKDNRRRMIKLHLERQVLQILTEVVHEQMQIIDEEIAASK